MVRGTTNQTVDADWNWQIRLSSETHTTYPRSLLSARQPQGNRVFIPSQDGVCVPRVPMSGGVLFTPIIYRCSLTDHTVTKREVRCTWFRDYRYRPGCRKPLSVLNCDRSPSDIAPMGTAVPMGVRGSWGWWGRGV